MNSVEKFLKQLERLATARGIVALLILLVLAFFVYKNFDFISEITFKLDRPKEPPPAEQERRTETRPPIEADSASVKIRNVQASPVDFSLPVYFYVEFTNEGSTAGRAEVMVDFGRANIESYEIRPTGLAALVSGGEGTNTLKLYLDSVGEDETV